MKKEGFKSYWRLFRGEILKRALRCLIVTGIVAACLIWAQGEDATTKILARVAAAYAAGFIICDVYPLIKLYRIHCQPSDDDILWL